MKRVKIGSKMKIKWETSVWILSGNAISKKYSFGLGVTEELPLPRGV